MLFDLEREFPVLATAQDPTKIQDLKSQEPETLCLSFNFFWQLLGSV